MEEKDYTEKVCKEFGWKLVHKFPTWATAAIVNDDYSGISDSDVELIRDYMSSYGFVDIVDTSEEIDEFCSHPTIGGAGEVYEWVVFAVRKSH